MSSTTFAVLQANATPVFADIKADTLQIDSESVRRIRSTRTKAIIPVALYGTTPDYTSLLDASHGLFMVEDNAEAINAYYAGRPSGSFGNAASYSFQASKHLTSGEGGIVTTDDEELANNIRRIQSLGYAGVNARTAKISREDIQDPSYDRHISMGWNYRMGELVAAVALAQTERAEELIACRVYAAKCFNEVTSEFNWIAPQALEPGASHTYWTWAAVLDTSVADWRVFRRSFMQLGGDGIYGAWKLTYLEPFFRERSFLGREKFLLADRLAEYGEGLCPVAESIQPRILQFKTSYWSRGEAERQADILRRVLLQWDRSGPQTQSD